MNPQEQAIPPTHPVVSKPVVSDVDVVANQPASPQLDNLIASSPPLNAPQTNNQLPPVVNQPINPNVVPSFNQPAAALQSNNQPANGLTTTNPAPAVELNQAVSPPSINQPPPSNSFEPTAKTQASLVAPAIPIVSAEIADPSLTAVTPVTSPIHNSAPAPAPIAENKNRALSLVFMLVALTLLLVSAIAGWIVYFKGSKIGYSLAL